MITQGINSATFFLYRINIYLKNRLVGCMFLLIGTSLNADLSHICAYSNESVVKFRKSTVGTDRKEAVKICLAEKIGSRHIPHFQWPVDLCDFWISSLFGPRTYNGVTKMHHGIDLASLKGTAVKASADGKVIKAQRDVPGYGTLVEIKHKKGFTTRYGHMEDILVKEGDCVCQADLIGTVGSHGNVRAKKDPSHLHFEIRQYGQSLNPLKYLYCSEVIFVE
jgi:murein DD-endopeptidase MepM/ murein hydrolase activator NlpD